MIHTILHFSIFFFYGATYSMQYINLKNITPSNNGETKALSVFFDGETIPTLSDDSISPFFRFK